VSGCGVKFHGEDQVADALLKNEFDSRLEMSDWKRPEALLARKANAQDCSGLTLERGRSLLLTFFGLTATSGRAFGIADGAVGGELRIAIIPVAGSSRIETLMPEAWVVVSPQGGIQ